MGGGLNGCLSSAVLKVTCIERAGYYGRHKTGWWAADSPVVRSGVHSCSPVGAQGTYFSFMLLNKRWALDTDRWNAGCEGKITVSIEKDNVVTEQAVKTQPKQGQSFSFIFHRFWPFICCLSLSGLIKGISPKMCILCVCVKINKRSFEPFCVLMLF